MASPLDIRARFEDLRIVFGEDAPKVYAVGWLVMGRTVARIWAAADPPEDLDEADWWKRTDCDGEGEG